METHHKKLIIATLIVLLVVILTLVRAERDVSILNAPSGSAGLDVQNEPSAVGKRAAGSRAFRQHEPSGGDAAQCNTIKLVIGWFSDLPLSPSPCRGGSRPAQESRTKTLAVSTLPPAFRDTMVHRVLCKRAFLLAVHEPPRRRRDSF